MTDQNIIESIKDKLQRGLISAADANVEIVRALRYTIVTRSLPRDVRAAYNSAVKSGRLGHYKKGIYTPECYYHPTFDYLARAEIAKHKKMTMDAVAKVAGQSLI